MVAYHTFRAYDIYYAFIYNLVDVCLIDSKSCKAGRWLHYVSPHDAMLVAATAAVTRTHHSHRAVLLATSGAQVKTAQSAMHNYNLIGPCQFRTLAALLAEGTDDPLIVVGKAAANNPRICYVFSGQGPQFGDMGRFLFATQPVFCEVLSIQ